MARRPGRWAAALLATAVATGCVTSPEVKLASTQMTGALEELQSSAANFRKLYVAEIESTRAEVGKAIVARAVRNRIEELSGDFGKPEWQEKFRQRGLISLSEEIEAVEDSMRRAVEEASKITLGRDQAGPDGVRRLIEEQVAALRTSAEALRAIAPREAELIEQKANALAAAGQQSEDRLINAYFVSLFELGAMKAEVPQNLKDLDGLIRMLRSTHAVVHDWVMTDVKVSGAKVAALLETNAGPLGLAAPAAPPAPVDAGGTP